MDRQTDEGDCIISLANAVGKIVYKKSHYPNTENFVHQYLLSQTDRHDALSSMAAEI